MHTFHLHACMHIHIYTHTGAGRFPLSVSSASLLYGRTNDAAVSLPHECPYVYLRVHERGGHFLYSSRTALHVGGGQGLRSACAAVLSLLPLCSPVPLVASAPKVKARQGLAVPAHKRFSAPDLFSRIARRIQLGPAVDRVCLASPFSLRAGLRHRLRTL